MTTMAVPGPPEQLTDATAGVGVGPDVRAAEATAGVDVGPDVWAEEAASVNGLKAGEAWALGATRVPQAITMRPADNRDAPRLQPMS
jgi:hypothetical protein